ncbi:MAG TPA: inorganic diphosphatase [Panacibacter sp.]|nr:inorganic diphosphatase [Panacibacter sp.]HNP46443.1 inorganic diphosphatase [Panacibacter sp.]
MNTLAISPINTKDKTINVIIETPARSPYKYAYDSELELFKVKKILPLGSSFPFDFGFVPNTKAGDGDPLDVLVIADHQLLPGILLSCRPIGVLEALQQEGKKRKVRNDRIIAIAANTIRYAGVITIDDLNKSLVQELEHFFINYNRHDGKIFTPKKWAGAKAAFKLIHEATNNSISQSANS